MCMYFPSLDPTVGGASAVSSAHKKAVELHNASEVKYNRSAGSLTLSTQSQQQEMSPIGEGEDEIGWVTSA